MAADLVLTENPRTVESADPTLWTDAGVVAWTELVLVVPATRVADDLAHAADGLPHGAEDLLSEAWLAVCGAYCGDLADEWLRASADTADTVHLLTFDEDVADSVGHVRAKDFPDVPPSSGYRSVLAVVDGEADLALAYRADAREVRGDDAWPIDRDFTTVMIPAVPTAGFTALVADGRDTAEATALVEWLRDGPGADVLESYGFDSP